MADDDKGEKPGTPLPVEHPAAAGIDRPVAPMAGDDKTPASEWTVSDRRGPLGSASDEDVERFVPAHEMDAGDGVGSTIHTPRAELATLGEEGPADHHDTVLNDHVGTTETAVSEEPVAPITDPEEAVAAAGPVRPVAAEPERKRSLVPVAAGVVIGALIGAGSAWLVYSQSDSVAGDQQQVAALSSRVDALDKRPDPQPEIAKLQASLGDVQGKVAALAKQPTAGQTASSAAGEPNSDAGLAVKVAALQTTVNELKTRTGAPSGDRSTAASSTESSSTTAKSPLETSQPAANSGLAGKVAALQAALDDLKTRTAALQAQDAKEKDAADKVAALQNGVSDALKQAASAQSSLDGVKSEQKQNGDKIADLTVAVAGALKVANGAQKEATGAQSGVQTVQSQQKVLEGKLGSPALAVVADSLVQQIDAGQPYTRQVEALATLSADPAKIAVLRENAAHGVPSAQALLAQWKPLADPVIATGSKAPAGANFGERLEHGLFGLVSVRRADTSTGNDLVSRVNLIEADLVHDDVPGAYSAWQALPADAKAKSASWGALAKTSIEALSAARDLQHFAIDALGAKKS